MCRSERITEAVPGRARSGSQADGVEAFPVKPAASYLSLIISCLDLCFAHCKCSFNTHLLQKQ